MSNLADELWLGYAGLIVDYGRITAIVAYQRAWDRRIKQSHGTLPAEIRCVVLLEDGRALPSRRPLDDLRRQWTTWQAARAS
jgi:hypothetical protein